MMKKGIAFFLILLAQLSFAKNEYENNALYENPVFWYSVITLICVLIFIFLRRNFDFFNEKKIDLIASETITLTSTRILGLAAIILLPVIEFIESELKGNYVTDWTGNIFIIVFCAALVFYSYSENVKIKLIENLSQLIYFILTIFEINRLFVNGFNISLISEICVLFLFSVLIIKKLKVLVVYAIFCASIAFVALYFSQAPLLQKTTFASCFMQTFIILFIFIIAEQKKINRLLHNENLLNKIPINIVVYTFNGNVKYVNMHFAKILGHNQFELIENGLWQVLGFTQEKIEEEKNILIERIKTGNEFDATQNLTGKSGNIYTIHWKYRTLSNNDLLATGNVVATKYV